MTQLYDEIGIGYGGYRRPDPRLATSMLQALGEVETVVNVGAGTGSYEPTDRSVVAVEPSLDDSSASARSYTCRAGISNEPTSRRGI